MCYRYSIASAQAVAEFCRQLGIEQAEIASRYNAALTQKLPVIVKEEGAVRLKELAFGFTLPPRPPDTKPLVLGNARAETLLDKPTFRAAAETSRCLVPADGFYEWEKAGAARLPHYFHLRDHRPFCFAGLWRPPSGDSPGAFAIVTTAPNVLLSRIHDRMPVLLGPNSGPRWLGDEPLAPELLARLCRPLPADMMASHRVSTRMNSARYEAPDCTAAVAE